MNDAPQVRAWTLPVMLTLWAALVGIVIWEIVYATRIMPQYENMYEGLGDSLPGLTRFFMAGLTHLVVIATFVGLALLSAIAWRLRRAAGLTVLGLSVLLGIGWMLTFRHAMKLPMDVLAHVFDDKP